MSTPVFVPKPCAAEGSGVDVESLILCDIVDEEVVGYALAVYDYDGVTGAPVGPPTFVVPGTNDPYTVLGILQPCPGENDCLTDEELRAEPVEVTAIFADENGVPYSESNPLPVSVGDLTIESLTVTFPDSEISAVNSSNVPLAAGDTFTGTWEDVLSYSAITAIIKTDQASALNGAVVQFSDDGATILRTVSATIPANVGLSFIFSPEARYFRIIYTNGATPQTFFHSQVLMHYQTPAAPQLPLAATTTDVTLAESTMAHLKGRLASGVNISLRADATGRLEVVQELPVALDAATLLALETIGLDAATLTALEEVGINPLTSWVTGSATTNSMTVPTIVISSPAAGRKTFAVKALSTNTQPVLVGSSSADVLAGGWELVAGESVVIEVDPTTDCWARTTTSDTVQGLCFIEVV